MNRLRFEKRARSLAALALLSAGLPACTPPIQSTPCAIPKDATHAQIQAAFDNCFAAESENFVDNRYTIEVDILFVTDNSASMTAKQRFLAEQLPVFFERIQSSRSHAHIGVITTDIGTTPGQGQTFPGSANRACNTFEGDDGRLQKTPCSQRAGQSPEAQLACRGGTTMVNGQPVVVPAACPDPSFVPGEGKSYIDLRPFDGTSNVKPLIENGKDLGPLRAFQCLALVGDSGCEVVSPLEAARRALDGHLVENLGFRRLSARLAVVFITDQDDCSVQLPRRADNDPNPITTFTSNGMSYSCDTPLARTNVNQSGVDIPARCYSSEYRCLARSLICDQPLNSPGTKSNCKLRTDSYLEPIDKYVSFFSRLVWPEDLGLSGIWPPSILDNPSGDVTREGKLVVQQESGATTAGLNRGFKSDAACYDATAALSQDLNRGFIGHAQTRLSTFLRRFDPPVRREASICNRAAYLDALAPIDPQIVGGQKIVCLDVKPTRTESGPLCLVGYVDAYNRSVPPETTLGECSSACCSALTGPHLIAHKDPKVLAACMPEPADCYCAAESQYCPATAFAAVWQKDNRAAPPDQVVSFRCTGMHPAL